MKKYIQFFSVVLLVIFFASCSGQKSTDKAKEIPSQPSILEISPPEVDPYFTGNHDINTSHGPSNITRNIIQDTKGNFWFATWEGIIHYNENSQASGQAEFTNITNREELRRFRVFTILEDKNGIIWFGTVGAGVYHYDGKMFTNITTKEGLVSNRIGCILEDKAGNIWFGTEGGVSKLNGNSLPTGDAGFLNFTVEEGLTNNDVNSIVEDKAGKFWIGTRGDACVYDGKTFTKITQKDDTAFENVRSIIEDKKGNIWLGGNDGLWRYDGSSFTNFTRDFVGYIYEDKKGNIWTSSESPDNRQEWILSKYSEKSLNSGKAATADQILKEKNMFFGIIEDSEENIWLGTLNGVYRYDGKTFNNF